MKLPQSSTSHSAAATALFLSRAIALGLVMATAACLHPTPPGHSAQGVEAACLNIEPYMKLIERAPAGEPSDEGVESLVTTHLYALERTEFNSTTSTDEGAPSQACATISWS